MQHDPPEVRLGWVVTEIALTATAPHQFAVPAAERRARSATRVLPGRPIRALMSNPCEPVGVGRTCRSILSSAIAAGYRADLTTARFDGVCPDGLTVRGGVPPLLRYLPFGRRISNEHLHRHSLDSIEAGDVA